MLSLQDVERLCAPVFDGSPIVARAFVFGSYARGEQDELSDVDICYDRPEGDVPQGLALLGAQADLRRALEASLGRPVDLLVTPDERTCAFPAQRRFAREVSRDKRRIYERS